MAKSPTGVATRARCQHDTDRATDPPDELRPHHLVLLHGQPGSGADWQQVAGRLPAHHLPRRAPAAVADAIAAFVTAIEAPGLAPR